MLFFWPSTPLNVDDELKISPPDENPGYLCVTYCPYTQELRLKRRAIQSFLHGKRRYHPYPRPTPPHQYAES
ncbi:hypothetical protein FA13DRAFT_1735492 [Coprinellus micaceus]|uniref:Uncharacterized protein n=1 Tax=Coprinellus micaceus TaxID=71717 RepID=A0A4Y7T3A7_COPMI|nr:hypothetical protein FA13DRAFT_1735492 [Coprinellus micaceus]